MIRCTMVQETAQLPGYGEVNLPTYALDAKSTLEHTGLKSKTDMTHLQERLGVKGTRAERVVTPAAPQRGSRGDRTCTSSKDDMLVGILLDNMSRESKIPRIVNRGSVQRRIFEEYMKLRECHAGCCTDAVRPPPPFC